ncbi:MAG: hypothetical protein ACFFDC_16430 [Promethearchaeota archaeon]
MASDDIDEFSTVFSSIYYAIRNSPEKQKLLINISSTQTTVSGKLSESQESASSIEESLEENEVETPTKQRKRILRPQPLFTFYSEIPPVEKKLTGKRKKKPKSGKVSPTRQLLTTALQKTKVRLSSQKIKPISKQKSISKKEIKKQAQKKIQDQTIRLNQFIQDKKVSVKIQEINIESQESTSNEIEPILNEDDPFPFTNLSEWLIWHHNYPELAFVREAYDPDQIPDEGDIEVFWVNIMNDPEFFNPEWRIAGSSISIDSIKQQKQPNWAPEWDILSSYTDGLSIFFEDVYSILSNYSQGLKNYRYPILQFALKGLLLLDLVYYDNQKWYRRGLREELSRLAKLDHFISEQENLSAYRLNLKTEEMKNDWYAGLVCFDLIIIRSSFLKRFSRNQIPEDDKVLVLKEEGLNEIVSQKLATIEQLEMLRVKSLRTKLESTKD